MPAQRRQTGITKKSLQATVMNVNRRNNLKKKIETENPIPALFKEFEERTKTIERLRRRIKEESALADMAFKKMKKFGLDGYNTVKVEEDEEDELEDYISSHAPTPHPSTPPRRSNRLRILTRPFDSPQLQLRESEHYHALNPIPIAGPSQPHPHSNIPPGLNLPPPFDPRIINNLPYCDGCQHYGHHVLYCPEAELGYPPEE